MRIKRIEDAPREEYVYDLCCSEPNSYVSNGFVSHNCVLLLDEVDKLFTATDTEGTLSRILGNLLWWLQEHDSTILTVMTANKIDELPKELYRAGRIDECIEFTGLTAEQMYEFSTIFVDEYRSLVEKEITADMIDEWVHGMRMEADEQTKVKTATPAAIKSALIKKLKVIMMEESNANGEEEG